MATGIQILSLDRIKRELSIPPNINDDDILLTGQIQAATDWAFRQTGHDLADTDASTVPDGYVGALVVAVRLLYDGLEFRQNAAVWSLLAPYRHVPFPAASGGGGQPVTPVTPVQPRYIGWAADRVIDASDFATAAESGGDELTIPSGGPGYVWFARPTSLGYPTSLTIAGTSVNQINSFSEQAGSVTFSLLDYVIGVSEHELSPALFGRVIHLGG